MSSGTIVNCKNDLIYFTDHLNPNLYMKIEWCYDWFCKFNPYVITSDLVYFLILAFRLKEEGINNILYMYNKKNFFADKQFRDNCRMYLSWNFPFGRKIIINTGTNIPRIKTKVILKKDFTRMFFRLFLDIKEVEIVDYYDKYNALKYLHMKSTKNIESHNFYMSKCVKNSSFQYYYHKNLHTILNLNILTREKFIDKIFRLCNTYYCDIDSRLLAVKIGDIIANTKKSSNKIVNKLTYSDDLVTVCTMLASKNYMDEYYTPTNKELNIAMDIEVPILEYFCYQLDTCIPKFTKYINSLFFIKDNSKKYESCTFSKNINYMIYFICHKQLYDTNPYFIFFILMTRFKIRRLIRFEKLIILSRMIRNKMRKKKSIKEIFHMFLKK